MDSNKRLKEALNLNPADRLRLIEALSNSLNKPDESIEKIWAEESEKRYKALEEGKIRVISFNEVIERYK
jgi:putative addiction module component (TIGR02574 family)